MRRPHGNGPSPSSVHYGPLHCAAHCTPWRRSARYIAQRHTAQAKRQSRARLSRRTQRRAELTLSKPCRMPTIRSSTSCFCRPDPAAYIRTDWSAPHRGAAARAAGATIAGRKAAATAGREATREAWAAVRINAVRNIFWTAISLSSFSYLFVLLPRKRCTGGGYPKDEIPQLEVVSGRRTSEGIVGMEP